jgi:hypothetical protein
MGVLARGGGLPPTILKKQSSLSIRTRYQMIGDGGNPKLHEVNAGHAKSKEAVKKQPNLTR